MTEKTVTNHVTIWRGIGTLKQTRGLNWSRYDMGDIIITELLERVDDPEQFVADIKAKYVLNVPCEGDEA